MIAVLRCQTSGVWGTASDYLQSLTHPGLRDSHISSRGTPSLPVFDPN